MIGATMKRLRWIVALRINLSGLKISQRRPTCVNLTISLVWRLREARSM